MKLSTLVLTLAFAGVLGGVVTPAQFTLATLAIIFALLIWSRLPPDFVLVGGVALLILAGILSL